MLILGIIGNPKQARRDPCDVLGEWDTHWYHDSSAVLLSDGEVVAAIEEERLTRRKHDGRFPVNAIRFCLDSHRVALRQVDCVAFGERGGEGYLLDPRISERTIAEVLSQELACPRHDVPVVRLVEHHLAHAMSAYGPSGFADALVMTADGFGDGISGMVVDAGTGRFDVLARIQPADSLGGYYSSVLQFLGYGRSDEYKIMGLAPYGDASTLRSLFRSTYDLRPDGRVEVRRDAMKAESLAERLRPFGSPREKGGPFSQFHKDVAAAVQASFEEMYFHVLCHFQAVTGKRDLCLAGGTAQNCSLTGSIARAGIFDRVFVQPAAYDAGLALGAALVVSGEAVERHPMTHVYWGTPPPDDRSIEELLASWRPHLDFERATDVYERTADALASGDVVGWVQGRSEFGPRALGNRSILADPRPKANKARVNGMVKRREEYRPFAPAVIEEEAGRYFELPAGLARSPFMTFVVKVKDDWQDRLGAVTHVDGTARIQTVSKGDNEAFWRLLKAFEARTGMAILLNTSFNNDVEPIVDSLEDALDCFLTTAIDHLVVRDVLVRRAPWTDAAVLGLVPRLRVDAALVRGTTRGAAEAPMRLIGNKPEKMSQISELAFKVLAADNPADDGGVELARSAGASDAQLPSLAEELLRLWSLRLISLRPRATKLRS